MKFSKSSKSVLIGFFLLFLPLNLKDAHSETSTDWGRDHPEIVRLLTVK